MGVTGAGKSTIALALNKFLAWPFQEGDDLHPPANIAKLHAGIPLTDADRAPWLAEIKHWIDARLEAGEPGLVTCSALKRSYRDFLIAFRPAVRILYLRANRAVLEQHLHDRPAHFMNPALLESQLATLEEPAADENPITIDIADTVPATVAEILRQPPFAAKEAVLF